jgi:Terminase small subunit
MKSTTASTPANSNATPEPKTAAPVPKPPVRTEAERAEMRAAFAREYLVDRNPAAAAVRAGYGKANASRVGKGLLENELVKAELAKLGGERHYRLNKRGRASGRRRSDVRPGRRRPRLQRRYRNT